MDKERDQLFRTILNDYGNMVARVCYMYGADEEQRKDLYQECMATVWQGLRSFRGDAKLSTWVYRTCINTCITCYRRSSKAKTVNIDDVVNIAADSSDRTGCLREMYQLISRLTPVEKAIIMMWLDEKSYDEISEVTGMPRNTVASRLRRIKAKLVELGNS